MLQRGLKHRRKIILAKLKINNKITLVKYETNFSFYFFIPFLLLSHFIFSVCFLYRFLFSFLFFFFLFLPLILILVFLLLYYSLPNSFPPHQKTIKKRLKTKHLEDERKQNQRPLISFFLDAALVGGQMANMEVATLQHGGGITEDEVDGALSYSRAE